jgi:GNAT superfamily N-acetyltransferase
LAEIFVSPSTKIRLVPVATADDFESPALRSRAGKAPHVPTMRLLRAMSDGVEVALVVLDVHEGAKCAILYELFLCSERRNRGVGTKVLAAIEDHVRASGQSCVEVWPRTLDRANRSDAQLIRWYTKHGYVPAKAGYERLRRVLIPSTQDPHD